MAAIVAAVFATIVAWWNLGLPRLVFSPEPMSDTQPSISKPESRKLARERLKAEA